MTTTPTAVGDDSVSQSQPCGEASADAEVFAGLDEVRAALARITEADAECPIRSGLYKGCRVATADACQRCGATDRESCGPNVRALVGLEKAVRDALSGAAIAEATGANTSPEPVSESGET